MTVPVKRAKFLVTDTMFGSVASGRGRMREDSPRGVGRDGDGDISCVESRFRFVVERAMSSCDASVFPRPRRRPEDRC